MIRTPEFDIFNMSDVFFFYILLIKLIIFNLRFLSTNNLKFIIIINF